MFFIFLLFLTCILSVHCKKDSVEKSNQNNTNSCDTTNVTYARIFSILSNNSCTGCHGAASSVPLNNYENVKAAALSGRLVGAVEHLSGFTPMPNSNQKIPECDRKAIKAWINQGTKN
ncbi:MAG: hypothetical protein NZ455_09575 [Bacteroidia bacterium]|nr:hypothetical protein [Bacteroidia bacterium]